MGQWIDDSLDLRSAMESVNIEQSTTHNIQTTDFWGAAGGGQILVFQETMVGTQTKIV
jgi:hypothetical protein